MTDQGQGPVDARIEISPAARETIETLAGESADGRETGGILLGRGPDERGVVHVEVAGEPGPHAERRPDYFLRDLKHAKQLAEDAWQDSKAVWVGEWHTHPMGRQSPSPTDLGTYLRLLSAASLEFKLFVSIIVIPDPELGWNKAQLWPWLLELRAIEPPGPTSDEESRPSEERSE
jgi:integrative and conjugative element protein (TIGR02256 family)